MLAYILLAVFTIGIYAADRINTKKIEKEGGNVEYIWEDLFHHKKDK